MVCTCHFLKRLKLKKKKKKWQLICGNGIAEIGGKKNCCNWFVGIAEIEGEKCGNEFVAMTLSK